jgi:hypothetical protein
MGSNPILAAIYRIDQPMLELASTLEQLGALGQARPLPALDLEDMVGSALWLAGCGFVAVEGVLGVEDEVGVELVVAAEEGELDAVRVGVAEGGVQGRDRAELTIARAGEDVAGLKVGPRCGRVRLDGTYEQAGDAGEPDGGAHADGDVGWGEHQAKAAVGTRGLGAFEGDQ